jgi:apolipoprotein N-acyltransferase
MGNLILCVLSGLLTGASFASPYTAGLIWFSLVPFIHVLSRAGIKAGLVSAFVFGLCYYGVAIFWIGHVSFLGLGVLLVYLSLYYLLFFLVGRHMFSRSFSLVGLASLWVIVEFLKENIWCGFGWANIGYSQYRNMYLIQVADIGGTKLISFLIVLVNVFLWQSLLFLRAPVKARARKREILTMLGIIAFLFLACFGYSWYRLNTLHPSGSLEVDVVQPNIPQELKWDPSYNDSVIETLTLLGRETRSDSLVVFPESSWPLITTTDQEYLLKDFLRSIERRALMGVVSKEDGRFYNTALLFGKEGDILQMYHKIRLVPFGEYVPLRRFLGFVSILNTMGDMSPGDTFSSFEHRSRNFSVLICFEDIFPLFVARLARDKDFLINITNDAWFYGQPQAGQHLGIMTLRALENRISIVRSANTGVSGWVSFKGTIETLKKDKQDVFFPGVGAFRVLLHKGGSVYSRYPGAFVFFCVFVVLIVLAQPLFAKEVKRP